MDTQGYGWIGSPDAMVRKDASEMDAATMEELQRRHRLSSPPENEVGVGLPFGQVLARTPDAALVLAGVEVFSHGWSFEIRGLLRPGSDRNELELHESFYGHPRRNLDAAQRLLLGIEYADGRRASTVEFDGGPFGRAGGTDDQVTLTPKGGSGNENSYAYGYWASQLPPAGPVTLVFSWTAVGIDEGKIELDGAAIAAAGAGAVELWPWAPSYWAQAESAPEPASFAPGSWFAQGAGPAAERP